MSSQSSSDESLTSLVRDALVEVYNNSPAGWHEFECAVLGALAEMSNEIAKAAAAEEEEDVDMVDADDDDDEDDDNNVEDGGDGDDGDDDNDDRSAPGPSGSGGAGQRGGRGPRGGRGGRIYHCPFAGCAKSYKATRTRTRHIKDKHPNQQVPPFNDP